MHFDLIAPYAPAGDQPHAIAQLVAGIQRGDTAQTLLGVTGSGKTFTIANTIAQLNKPTLLISHNKTLAAQLYGELKQFFPNNLVEYFVSYYDYYQPEAYIATTGTYIEKELAINDELETLRLSTVTSLLTGRKDVIVVASVSCIYGVSKPEVFKENMQKFQVGDQLGRNHLLRLLVDMLYSRSEDGFNRGNFRVKGDSVDIFLAYADYAYRFIFWGDELEAIQTIDPATGKKRTEEKEVVIFPANLFIMSKDILHRAIENIQRDLSHQINYFEELGQFEEANRIKDRTELDLEMLRELGYCSGIENYSRYIDGRSPGERPFCLLDYFPEDYLMVIDESHVTIPQIRAMFGGDRARKVSLVENAFRLPAAMDNRPLNFNEFNTIINQAIFVSATPADYELNESEGVVVEQIIRPTGLLDPIIEVRPSLNQIDDLLGEIERVIKQQERVLITTLTKRMAEELNSYLANIGIKCRYIHSEVKTLDRVVILRELRLGIFDVLIGVNLLREGLDLPEVALVAILDADKEGFLRNVRSLIQTIGRVARNEHGKAIMYADKITASMATAMSETARRRSKQLAHNEANQITPQSVHKTKAMIMSQTKVANKTEQANDYITPANTSITAEPIANYTDQKAIKKQIKDIEKHMETAAKMLNFLEADRLKQELEALQKLLH